MTYLLLSIAVTLAFFALVQAGTALVAALFWRIARRRAEAWSPEVLGRLLFTLRVAPPVVALIVAAGFVLPAFLLYEPVDTREAIGLPLAVVALSALVGVAIAIVRAARTALATRRLAREWLAGGAVRTIAGAERPVHIIRHPFPVLAVVGVLRPRIFASENVLATLADGEVLAAIAHETAHLAGRDNLKRAIIDTCRYLLVLPIGSAIDRAWARSAERLADQSAANARPAAALELASALVKISRMVPVHAPRLPVGAYIASGGESDIAGRVEKLLDTPRFNSASVGGTRRAAFIGSVSAIALLAALAVTGESALRAAHGAIEFLVHRLG